MQVESIRLAAAWDELLWRSGVLPVREIDLPQATVPGDRVDGVLAGRGLSHRGHGRLAARAERIVRPSRLRQCAVEATMPDLPATRDVDAKQVVGYAGDNSELTRALGCCDALGHERRKQVVHRARLALELQLPQQLHAPDVGRREHFLVAHPAGPRVIHTLCQEVGCATGRARQQQNDDSHPRNSHDSLSRVRDAESYGNRHMSCSRGRPRRSISHRRAFDQTTASRLRSGRRWVEVHDRSTPAVRGVPAGLA